MMSRLLTMNVPDFCIHVLSFSSAFPAVRGFLARRKYKPILLRRHSAIIAIQATARGFIQRKRYEHMREETVKSVIKIQAGGYIQHCS